MGHKLTTNLIILHRKQHIYVVSLISLRKCILDSYINTQREIERDEGCIINAIMHHQGCCLFSCA